MSVLAANATDDASQPPDRALTDWSPKGCTDFFLRAARPALVEARIAHLNRQIVTRPVFSGLGAGRTSRPPVSAILAFRTDVIETPKLQFSAG
jgi:hypothetical protein